VHGHAPYKSSPRNTITKEALYKFKLARNLLEQHFLFPYAVAMYFYTAISTSQDLGPAKYMARFKIHGQIRIQDFEIYGPV